MFNNVGTAVQLRRNTQGARFVDLTEVRATGNIALFSTAIRFRTNRASAFAVFWTFRRSEILDALEAAGLTVNREPARFHLLNPNRD